MTDNPTASVDITESNIPGPPGLVYLGSWLGTTVYAERDAVEWQGSFYICRIPSVNVSPSSDSDPTNPQARWGLMVARGATGDSAWTPIFTLERQGYNVFLRIVDWINGSGARPELGYLGANGLIYGDISQAISLRGDPGAAGERGLGGLIDLDAQTSAIPGIAYRAITSDATEDLTALAEGMSFIWQPPENSLDNPTLNVSGLGDYPLLTPNVQQPGVGAFQAGSNYMLLFKRGGFIQLTENNESALADSVASAKSQIDQALVLVLSTAQDVAASLSNKADRVHTHVISDVSGLQAAINAKANLQHTHDFDDVIGLQSALDTKAATVHRHSMADVDNLSVTLDGKAPLTHTHAIADVTGLQAALDTKASGQDLGNGLATKADDAATTAALNLKANASDVNNALADKADSAATVAALALKADNTTVVSALATKLDAVTAQDLSDFYG